MLGRSRGNQERIIALAHQIEAMSRQKSLKPLSKYLEPAKPTRKAGAGEVLEMFKRLKAKQDAKGAPDG